MNRSGRKKARAGPLDESGAPALDGEDAAPEARPTAPEAAGSAARVQRLQEQVAAGLQQSLLVTNAVRRMASAVGGRDSAGLPARLTPRARRLLEHGRELLGKLRQCADDLRNVGSAGDASAAGLCDPLAVGLRRTTAMLDFALRAVQGFPPSAGDQLVLCQGLEGVLAAVARRAAGLGATVRRRRASLDRLSNLIGGLVRLNNGSSVLDQLNALAGAVVEEVRWGVPLDSWTATPRTPALFAAGSSDAVAQQIARHSLMTAQVLARIVGRDPDWAARPVDAVLAALVHDVGMLQVDPSITGRPGAFDLEARREVERHAPIGAAAVARAFSGADWLVEAVASHHERFDGTGYPAGQRGPAISTLGRLLAVCDVYAALCQDRPHRPAKDTRTALTDTLLLAEQGVLDPERAAWLLGLSFYPVGTAVELEDGSVGVVVATHMGRRDETTAARPVVAVVADSERRPYPAVRHVDLSETGGSGVARVLSADERRRLTADWPELGAGGEALFESACG